MPSHFSMGALNKQTNEYEYPAIANKSNCYKCPECDNDVIFKKGKVNRPHFAHKKSETPCTYYDRPNESQIHKDAKNLLYSLLKSKTLIDITRTCVYCKGLYHISGLYKGNTITHHYYEHGTPKIEHSFKYNNSNKRADVALLSHNHIDNVIFEICHKHSTRECDRPDPWFEFDALTLINDVNSQIQFNFPVSLHCLRQPFNNHECSCFKLRKRQQEEEILHEEEQLHLAIELYKKKLLEQEEERKRKEEDKIKHIAMMERIKEADRLYKLKQEEEKRKKLEQQEEELKRRKAAEEAEKLRREDMIERIRRKYPNILRAKGT